MYIVAIAWLYITVLMAATERNLVAGVMTFLTYGLGPLALFLWLFGGPRRRRAKARRESSALGGPTPEGWASGGTGRRPSGEGLPSVSGDAAHEPDGADAKPDQ